MVLHTTEPKEEVSKSKPEWNKESVLLICIKYYLLDIKWKDAVILKWFKKLHHLFYMEKIC